MKRDMIPEPKSAFLGFAKDTAIIMNRLLDPKSKESQDLLKLIYHNTKDCLDIRKDEKYRVTDEQIAEMLDTKQISNVPKVWVDLDKKTYLRVTYDSFTPNATNPFYRDHIVEIKILCHFDNWDLGDYDLRPYRIAGIIDSKLDGTKLSGIGQLNFISADQDIYDEEYGGLTLRYLAVRGTEDKQAMVRPLV